MGFKATATNLEKTMLQFVSPPIVSTSEPAKGGEDITKSATRDANDG
jgi:hypothetical protein